MGLPISDSLIVQRGIYLKDKLNIDIDCEFSNGWLRNFKNRYNIIQRRGSSKIIREDDCEIETIINFIKLVNEKIDSEEYSSIINIDETGLYYDSKVNYTLDTKGTKRVEIKTTGREKQRVTILLGIDLLDNINLNPFIIFKGNTQRCINKIPNNNQCILSYQKNAWCDEKEFIKFLSLLPTNKKILLVFDNVPSHNTDRVNNYLLNNYPLIDVLRLPKCTTSILQPLDVGINKPFKVFIQKQYIDWLIKHYNNKKTLPKINITKRNILLTKWISASWKNIDNEIIKKVLCFVDTVTLTV